LVSQLALNTWCIPYIDQPAAFWEEIATQFGDYIRAVYFPMPGGVIASGRPPQPERLMTAFLQYASLPKAVLVNPILLSQPVEHVAPQIIENLARLRDNYGVCDVTVSNPSLAKRIKTSLPGFKVTASILMGISTLAQLETIQEYVDVIVPDNRILRDLKSLKMLRKAFKGELRLIVNEACLPGCLYRVQHFYEMAYGGDFPESLCQPLLAEKPWLRLTSGWVLPQHLEYYAGLYDSLKIAGRVTLRDPIHYKQVLNAYIHRKHLLPCEIGAGPASVQDPIQLSDAMFKTILNCAKNCHGCKRCEQYYENALSSTD